MKENKTKLEIKLVSLVALALLGAFFMIVLTIIIKDITLNNKIDNLDLGCDSDTNICQLTDGEYFYKIYSNGGITSWSKTDLDYIL